MWHVTYHILTSLLWYGVATISRLLKIIGLFCRIWLFYRAVLQKRPVILRSLLLEATQSYVSYDLIRLHGMMHSHVWHGSFTCVTHSYVWDDSFTWVTCVTWLIHECTWLIHEWTWLIHEGILAHVRSHIRCIFTRVSCAEYSLFYRAVLQKRPVISRSPLVIATPYL